MVKQVSDRAEFNKIIGQDKYTFVNFTASWCGPCKKIDPVFEKLAEEHQGIDFIKVDVDEAAEIARWAGIHAAPTFILFHGGEQAGETIGAKPSALHALIAKTGEA
ncbi:thioredoxin family protein [Actinomadura kijaniata]|uniref:thioredoxin family protein n=1 Tax=Actinomadura kijaniata TaxID=46161 RepID=UPI003F1D67F2